MSEKIIDAVDNNQLDELNEDIEDAAAKYQSLQTEKVSIDNKLSETENELAQSYGFLYDLVFNSISLNSNSSLCKTASAGSPLYSQAET